MRSRGHTDKGRATMAAETAVMESFSAGGVGIVSLSLLLLLVLLLLLLSSLERGELSCWKLFSCKDWYSENWLSNDSKMTENGAVVTWAEGLLLLLWLLT